MGRGVLSGQAESRRRCSRTTRRGCRRSRSTTPSIGCPRPQRIQSWRGQVTDSFRFAIKVPRRISHFKRLRDCARRLTASADSARRSRRRASARCSCNYRRTRAATPRRSRPFSATLPAGTRVGVRVPPRLVARAGRVRPLAVAQRRARAERKRRRRSSCCRGPPTGRTYACAASITTAPISSAGSSASRLPASTEAQVFFKHEDGATGPKLAAQLLAMAEALGLAQRCAGLSRYGCASARENARNAAARPAGRPSVDTGARG